MRICWISIMNSECHRNFQVNAVWSHHKQVKHYESANTIFPWILWMLLWILVRKFLFSSYKNTSTCISQVFLFINNVLIFILHRPVLYISISVLISFHSFKSWLSCMLFWRKVLKIFWHAQRLAWYQSYLTEYLQHKMKWLQVDSLNL